ncbi:hypothetical protein [Clostridium sp. DJ247]|uniref:hypothetical protein n=1 Tax=Clostridium sp. DJ247 TaxID=2726188 RepID=UPI001627F498|nr:hypothetical protein [Clostridium sp. DJ247]MBC2582435.1 hypothetical protein [Clostridium sp. DJ247]
MGIYINTISTFILILGLIIIYRKSDKSEDFLFMKLVSYYLLGSFRFNFNKLAIPLGFIIYLIFLRPKLNTRSKRRATLLGLIFFIIGLSIPSINKYLYERPKEVTVHSVSINTIDFQKDWELIKEKLEINHDTRLEGFEINYENDGTIRELRYELISRKEGGLVHYFIDLLPHKEKYIIRPSKIEQLAQYDRLVTAERFFQVISFLNLEQIRPRGLYEWHGISCRGELVNYAIKENDKFIIISKNNVKKISNDELPIKSYYISSYGMGKKSESSNSTSYESEGKTDYFFDVIKN